MNLRPFYRPCDQAMEAAIEGNLYLTKANLEEAVLDYRTMTRQAKARWEFGLVEQLHRYWLEILDECHARLSGGDPHGILGKTYYWDFWYSRLF